MMQSEKMKLILFFLLIAFYNFQASAQGEPAGETTEKEVSQMLQKRNISELASALARQKPSRNTAELLKRLSIFGRAGHRLRVHETLKQLAEADDLKSIENRYYLRMIMRKAIGPDDFTAHKFYYESFAINGDSDADEFIALWRKTGNIKETENWLAVRRQKSDIWWQEHLRLKQSLGTAQDVYDELEQEVRANPNDWYRIARYFQAAGNSADTSWIAEVVPTDSSYSAHKLGTFLKEQSPYTAVKLFERSLSLPFSGKDIELFGQWAFRGASISPIVKNPEKQTRFWTKKALAELYLKTNQPHLVQPLAQELIAMDTSDIYADDVFRLGGMAQASSGQRVIESKILLNEAQKQDSPEYWLERIQYYRGRRENEMVWQTCLKALEKFSYKAGDLDALNKRLRIIWEISTNRAYSNEEEARSFLRREFTQSKGDERYIFEIVRQIDEFDDLLDEIFVNTDLLPQILKVRANWQSDERNLIMEIMPREAWDAKKREAVWIQLSALAMLDVRNRAYSLADAMTDRDAHRNALPLLEACLKIAPLEYGGDPDFTRADVEYQLFKANLEIGDWRKAEKVFMGDYRNWREDLGSVALAAAKSGDIKDSLRLWKMNSNYDRRNINGLKELAKTGAKLPLREFYLHMKRIDPLTDIPDKALSFLN